MNGLKKRNVYIKERVGSSGGRKKKSFLFFSSLISSYTHFGVKLVKRQRLLMTDRNHTLEGAIYD